MISSVASCSICKDPLEEGQGVQLNCQHEFHRSCIDTWIDVRRRDSRAPSCPLDRSRITAINGEPLENSEVSAGGRENMINELSRHIILIFNPRSYNQRMQEIFDELSRHIDSTRSLDVGHNQRLQQTLEAFRSSLVLPRYPDE